MTPAATVPMLARSEQSRVGGPRGRSRRRTGKGNQMITDYQRHEENEAKLRQLGITSKEPLYA